MGAGVNIVQYIVFDECAVMFISQFETTGEVQTSDSKIVFFLWRMYRANLQENKRSMAKLLLSAEGCKHTLSNLDNSQCAVDSLYDGIDFHTSISRLVFYIADDFASLHND